ncbi:MAG: primosomal protein N' [Chloroflexi bacterium]|nr:primosomal protein N' [Chloroflexota bacterium]
MHRVYIDVIIVSSEKQKGSDTTYTYHHDQDASDSMAEGQIVYVPLASQTVIGVVLRVHTQSPSFTTKALITTTQFRLSNAQIALAHWMSRHYHAQLATMLGQFVTHAVVPPPELLWQISATGIDAPIHDLPEDERGLLFVLKQHHVLQESQLRSISGLSRSSLRKLQKWLVARGYITVVYRVVQANVTSSSVKYLCYVDHTQKVTPAQQRVIETITAHPNKKMPLASIGNSVHVKKLVQMNVCILVEEDEELAPIGTAVTLSQPQQQVVDTISQHRNHHATFLLEGVTGSGKTEVYFALIDACIAQGQQVLVLAPEIALTTQLAERFSKRFPGRVGVIHGQVTPSQRRQHWIKSLSSKLPIIVGPRSAIYVPQPHLGLIIVDEEHDTSYKSDFAPFIHARDAAIMYGKLAHVPVVLGSATPSVEIIHAAQQRRITHLQLPQRLDNTGTPISMPPVRVIDMRNEVCVDQYGLIGKTLASAITDTLALNKQVLLLLNRRGNAGARICRGCGAVARCERCSTPMAIHTSGSTRISTCHTCGSQRYPETHCKECYGVDFMEYGSGTQRIVEIIEHNFPETTVLQWDRDTADSAADHRSLLKMAQDTPNAVIVGTQMIAKGLDLPDIRLVGVINTDIALHLPDFRAAERTFQLLTQVAGRAGRRDATATVILQSYQVDNYAIQAAARYHSAQFYEEELRYRAHLGYPPFNRMIKLVWQHANMQTCEQRALSESRAILDALQADQRTRLIGPTPAFFSRVRGMYRWQLLIVTSTPRASLARIDALHHAIVDMDPVSLL